MQAKRFGRMQKATAIVPLALLSAAWTASLAGVQPATSLSTSASSLPDTADLPGGGSVPVRAIEAPASVSSADEASPAFDGTDGDIEQIVATSSTNGIPSSALAAYQRAELVINRADPGCHLSWQLIAAIGRVESDHGRFAGSSLNSDGVATPAILGPVLDGSGGTSAIRDTDNGAGDGDKTYDRAMGPMQFIPSTWSVVQVDADNDGVRNPQDIDDAALATAVYLCSGTGDLSTLTGQKSAVYRYNHSDSYVNLVLSIMDNYLSGDYTSVPDNTTAAGYLTPVPPVRIDNNNGGGGKHPTKPDTTPTADPAPETTQPSDPAPADPAPTDNGGGGGNPGGGGNDGPVKLPPVKVPPVKVPPLPTTSIGPVDDVLTLIQAQAQCMSDLGLQGVLDSLLATNHAYNQCVKDYTTKP
ncbi:hypothetical protein BH11ACT8_BH11ACT8_30770 [soil metagenome]